MKGKLLIGLTLATFISANAFAIEIHNGRVTQHKEWSTGKIKAVFKDEQVKLSDMKIHLPTKSQDDYPYINGYAGVSAANGIAGLMVPIAGHHQVVVSNHANVAQDFFHQNSVCLETSAHTEECTYSYDRVTLEPQGYAFIAKVADVSISFLEPGSYHVSASTTVGLIDQTNNIVTNSRSMSMTDIEIAAKKS